MGVATRSLTAILTAMTVVGCSGRHGGSDRSTVAFDTITTAETADGVRITLLLASGLDIAAKDIDPLVEGLTDPAADSAVVRAVYADADHIALECESYYSPADGGDTLVMASAATWLRSAGRRMTPEDIGDSDALTSRLREAAAKHGGLYTPSTVTPTDEFTIACDSATFFYSPGVLAPASKGIIKLNVWTKF